MQAPSSLFHGMQRGLAAIKGIFAKSSNALTSGEDLRDWLNARPDIADEARQGFKQIDAGQYRKVSRRKHA